MKLLKLHVNNFGTLSEKDYVFDAGVSSFLESNGSGKTTLASFIAVLFYGFYDENGRVRKDGLRARFRPWQGGAYGGYLEFESGGLAYRLERYFGSKPAEDELSVYHRDTLIPTNAFGPVPGISLFGIDAGSFAQTVFISDNRLESGVSDEVHAKLGGLLDDAADIGNFQRAEQRLLNLLNTESPTRVTGRIRKMKMDLEEMKAEIREEAAEQRALSEIEEKERELRQKMDSVENAFSEAEAQFAEIERLRQAGQAIRQREEALLKEAEAKADEARIADHAHGKMRLRAVLSSFFTLVLLFFGLLGLNLVPGISLRFPVYLPPMLCALASALLVFSIVLWVRFFKWKDRAEQDERTERIEILRREIAELKKAEKASASNGFSEDPATLSARMRAINAERRKLDSETHLLSEARSLHERRLLELSELREKHDALEEEIDEALIRYRRLESSLHFLREAKIRFAARYASPVRQSFRRYISVILGEETDRFKLDAAGNVSIEEAGALRSLSMLSHGYQDLVWFSMRIALVDAMYAGEPPALILDDPFVNLDAEKFERAKRLVRELASRYQILYFTCHESRRI